MLYIYVKKNFGGKFGRGCVPSNQGELLDQLGIYIGIFAA